MLQLRFFDFVPMRCLSIAASNEENKVRRKNSTSYMSLEMLKVIQETTSDSSGYISITVKHAGSKIWKR